MDNKTTLSYTYQFEMLSLALIGITLLWRKNMELSKWKEKNKYSKGYAHFDDKASLEKVWDYISNPNKIIHHGFYPFIHYEKSFFKYKFDKDTNKVTKADKNRELCYSAHKDRYIFSYYGYLLNQEYNSYVKAIGINEVALAYRDNFEKMSNVQFAKMAFDFIRDKNNCYIIIGDLTHFFDNLNHKYLKDMLCKVLKVKKLPDDYYAVYKNITKYSQCELKDVLKLCGLETSDKGYKELNTKNRIFDSETFNKIKKENPQYIKRNKNDFGIPQGSAISAVMSNIYMIDADLHMKKYVEDIGGMYMRYSDDFILVLPYNEVNIVTQQFNELINIIKKLPNMEIEPKKTQVFAYDNDTLTNCNSMFLEDIEDGKNFINYLGFTFDGKEVTIREKTVAKYYYRMYRKLKTIVKHNGYINGKRISCAEVYEKYSMKGTKTNTHNGINKKVKGNFISYVNRAQMVFENEPIDRKTKRHMLKIRRKINKAFENHNN